MTVRCPHCGFTYDDDEEFGCATCNACGVELRSDDDHEEGLCAECVAGLDAAAAIEAIEERDFEMATEILGSHSSIRKNVVSELVAEADYYARKGDFDEAEFRLRCATQPKFASIEECQQRYAAAMAQKYEAAA
jgi:hypothetical protein